MSGKTIDSSGATPLKAVRILHLEDNVPDQLLLEATLAANGLQCDLIHATGKTDFEAALQQNNLDLIISDFSLPGYDGLSALTAARNLRPGTPFMFVSGTIGEERAVESLKSGATDYVLKDNLPRLIPAVKRALREAAERSERQQLEAQLRQSQKMEAIGQLAGGVAHDFNNLLTVIRGNVEMVLLRSPEVSAETREYLKQVTATADRAANLTRQLLTFGRKQAMRPEPVNLNEVTNNLAKMLTRVIGREIEVECTFATLKPYVMADVSMMEQVLLNLVVNARDAMPKGGRLLITTGKTTVDEARARAHPEARPGDFVCWSVSDTGTGIPPEHLARIFEPFYSTKAPDKGTGLGLSTVYGIVKQHEGWIEVFTQIGSGTSFRIFLPEIPAPPAPEPTQNLPVQGGHERILLADEEPTARMLTRRVLETFGYEVLEAASGQEVLKISQSGTGKIDLLLTGLVLPDGATGPELAEELRKSRPSLKVIFVSGYDLDVAQRDTAFTRRNGICFLQRPCASQALVSTVRRCLDERDVNTISA